MQTFPPPEPSDELLAEAARAANDILDAPADDWDVDYARDAIRATDPTKMCEMALLIAGYVTVAMRGGRR